jgi:hypothetical protein
MTREIRSLGFGDDGMSIEYVDTAADIKANGLLMNHALLVPDTNDYHDAMEALRLAAGDFLDDVLNDWDAAEPALQLSSRGPAEEIGPYDNPLERDIGGAP